MNICVRRIGFLVCGVVSVLFATGTARADLLINVSPPTVSIAPGQEGKVSIESQPQAGFPTEAAATIEYTLLDFAVGNADPVTTTGPAFPPASMRISVNPDTPAESYPATIRAVLRDNNGTEIGDKTFPNAVTVTVASTGTFTFRVLQTKLDITAGGEGRATLMVQPSGGFSSPVTLEFSAPGTSITADTPRTSTAPSYDAHGVLITVPADVPPGTHPGLFTATAGSETRTAQIDINVTPALTIAGDYEVTVDSNPINASGDRSPFTFTITSTGGFSGAVTATMGFPEK